MCLVKLGFRLSVPAFQYEAGNQRLPPEPIKNPVGTTLYGVLNYVRTVEGASLQRGRGGWGLVGWYKLEDWMGNNS